MDMPAVKVKRKCQESIGRNFARLCSERRKTQLVSCLHLNNGEPASLSNSCSHRNAVSNGLFRIMKRPFPQRQMVFPVC